MFSVLEPDKLKVEREEQTSRKRPGEHIITSVIKTKYKGKQKLKLYRFTISVELIAAQNEGARGSELFIQ